MRQVERIAEIETDQTQKVDQRGVALRVNDSQQAQRLDQQRGEQTACYGIKDVTQNAAQVDGNRAEDAGQQRRRKLLEHAGQVDSGGTCECTEIDVFDDRAQQCVENRLLQV